MRGLQVASCVDAKQLPDVSSLKDKMSLAAYDHGMGGGADASAAALLLIAVEVHLRALISDTMSLARPKHRADTERIADVAALTSDGGQAPDVDLQGPSLTQRSLSSGSGTSAPRQASPRGLIKPLQAEDVANLSEIAPYAFVQAHPGVLERFEAFKGLQDTSDDEAVVAADQQEPDRSPGSVRMADDRSPIPRAAAQLSEVGRADKLAAKLAQSSLAGSSLGAFPGSPTGTVDAAGPGAPSRASTGLSRVVNGSRRSTTDPDGLAAAEQGQQPKNLAEELFPEDDDGAKAAAARRPSRALADGAASGSESDDAPVTAGASGGVQRKKKHGWDRVDTFRLLEGVGHT